jgi:hypothetical protein
VGEGSDRLTLGPPLAPGVAERTDQLLLLGIHADHRVTGRLVALDVLIDVAELPVAVRVLLALNGLGVGLQTEPLRTQQVRDGVSADPVPLGGQLAGQHSG